MMDKCVNPKGSKVSMKLSCDTAGMHVNTYTDAKCTKLNKKTSQSVAWGKCHGGVILKGAETLKMAITGAALALVASQF